MTVINSAVTANFHNILSYLDMKSELMLSRTSKSCNDLFKRNLAILEIMKNRSKLELRELLKTPLIEPKICVKDQNGEILGRYYGRYLSALLLNKTIKAVAFFERLNPYTQRNIREIEIGPTNYDQADIDLINDLLIKVFEKSSRIETLKLQILANIELLLPLLSDNSLKRLRLYISSSLEEDLTANLSRFKLEELELDSWNRNITGKFLTSLKSNCLKKLTLDISDLQEQYLIDNLPRFELEELALKGDNIIGKFLTSLKSNCLKKLTLDISDLQEQYLIDNLPRFELEKLDLRTLNRNITGEFLKKVAGRSLKILILSSLYSLEKSKIGSIFELFPNLEVLIIAGINIESDILKQIPKDNNLKVLDFYISSTSTDLLINVLRKCPNLLNRGIIKNEIYRRFLAYGSKALLLGYLATSAFHIINSGSDEEINKEKFFEFIKNFGEPAMSAVLFDMGIKKIINYFF
jgi:hypothetical protein